MPVSTQKIVRAPLTLIYGQEFLVKQRARELVAAMADSAGEFGLEIIEGHVANMAEALTALSRVTEAVNTAPFFGGEKTVWLKDASFLGTDRTSASEAVTDALTDFSDLLKRGLPPGVTLFISAAEVDARRGFFKTCEKQGTVIALKLPEERSREAQAIVSDFILAKLRAAHKTLEADARERLLETVSSDLRQLDNELEKLITYVGPRQEITSDDILAIVSVSRGALVWDLTDAFGDRDLPKALAVLENLLYRGENALGLLFALIGKTRALLLLRDLLDQGFLQVPKNYNAPAVMSLAKEAANRGKLPPDKAFNPLQSHPYTLYKNLGQATSYTVPELVAAQSLWLATNEKLVSSSLDPSLVLVKALAQLMKTPEGKTA